MGLSFLIVGFESHASMYRATLLAIAASLALAVPSADAQIFPDRSRSSAQRDQDRMLERVPQCARSLGTLTIADGDAAAYDALQLQPPQTLLRLVVQRSGCFTLVDRGSAAMTAIERERQLAMSGQLQSGSNMGAGQIRAADYILLAEVASANSNVSGQGVQGHANIQPQEEPRRRRGMLGGLTSALPGAAVGLATGGVLGGNPLSGGGMIGGGVNSQTGEANTVLSIVSVRTAETLAATQGYAARRDVDWNLHGSAAFGGLVGGGYENTELGRILAQAFINGYSELVRELNRIEPDLPPAP